jgi:transglutaminase-like putative cysteine protease
MATLFVAALRAQGVPARVLAGRWAKSAVRGERVGALPYFQGHVKAEFFAQGVGWVPADLSSAVVHDRSPEKLRYFGSDRGDFLTLHVDTDLVLDTVHFGSRSMTYLQNSAYWATGSGSFEGAIVTKDWRVTPVGAKTGKP